MFVFGKEIEYQSDSSIDIASVLRQAKQKLLSTQAASIDDTIEVLARVGSLWQEGGEFHKKGLHILNIANSFSPAMNEQSLTIIPELFKKNNLLARVRGELIDEGLLERFCSVKNYNGRVKYTSVGVVLHITAGNIFLGAIDSLLMAILTKNISIVKVSSNNTEFCNLFLQSFLQADYERVLLERICFLSWKGGNQVIEDQLKKGVDLILAWGGEQMAASYRQNLSADVTLIEHGPKISFHVISKKFYQQISTEDYEKIARDICSWDQSACSNSQNVFLENGIDINKFIISLDKAMDKFPIRMHELSIHERSDRESEYHRGLFQEYESGHPVRKGEEHLIHFDQMRYLSTTGLNRHVKVKSYEDLSSLCTDLSEFSYYLQTCGLGVTSQSREQYRNSLGDAGVNRFTALGGMTEGLVGSPHDGSYNLIDLVRIVNDESEIDIKEFALDQCAKLEYYKGLVLDSFEDIPLINGELLAQNSIDKSNAFLNPERGPGKMFSSGGTTGNPKYCFYENTEFEMVADVLAKTYRQTGLGTENVENVGNLFVAGNMWSSFSIIQYALDRLNVNQFPMGGMINVSDFKALVSKFEVTVLFGLPSLLTDFAHATAGLQIKSVYYAGEPFSKAGRELLKANWGCEQIISAGYASVDVGPIGYQDESCSGNEHYLLDELVHLEVIAGEAVITSKVRQGMPVIRYQTGDQVSLVNCVNNRIKFNLLGRVDGLINIWSCRFYQSEFELILNSLVGEGHYQVLLESRDGSEYIKVLTQEVLQSNVLDQIRLELYSGCHDINQTHDLKYISQRICFEHTQFLNNKKTGKIKSFFDLRTS
jgi:phenylacetate-CoA ligase